jgi:tRNA modification GTPase
MSLDEDTIAAIATPTGQAGIGIIRISGPNAYSIAEKIFRAKRPHNAFKSHSLYLGNLYVPSSGEIIDEVLISFMKSPHTYTKEDIVEINSHSGYLLLSKILQIILDQGARLAKPGEFTFRAFMNGRIDLTQAEAIIDIINSKSEKGLALAAQQNKGQLRDKIEKLRAVLIDILGHFEVEMDYPDEDIGNIANGNTAHNIEKLLISPIEALIKDHARKTFWIDGVNTVIVGRVNAGKSSLLNRLLNEQRAIVTPYPGTTRDVIESTININGLPLLLMDTAGLRRSYEKDEAEKIGVSMTQKKISEADLLLIVIDRSQPLNLEDHKIIDQSRGKKALIVINKCDLPAHSDLMAEINSFAGLQMVKISALTGEGLEHLRESIVNCILEDGTDTTPHSYSNMRYRKSLMDSIHFLRNSVECIRNKKPVEITAFELKSALDALGEIIGETTPEDVLDSIFSRFCLGK